MRDLEVAPRLAVAWAPKRLPDTKFSAGWGVYYDSISLDIISRQQEQISLATFYSPAGVLLGPVATSFLVNDQSLRAPYSHTASFSVERKLPGGFYLRSGVMRRAGHRGFTFRAADVLRAAFDHRQDGAAYRTRQCAPSALRRFRDLGAPHVCRRATSGSSGIRGRARARTQPSITAWKIPFSRRKAPGPFAWDTPNRVHMWGWAPLPNRVLPPFLRFMTRQYDGRVPGGIPHRISVRRRE